MATKQKCCVEGCKKKANGLDIVCMCGQKFCMAHRLPEDHGCQFDFKEYERKRLFDLQNRDHSTQLIESYNSML